MSIDFALDKDTHDLLFIGNDLQLVQDSDQVEQHISIRLLFFKGEWFIDESKGIPYYQNILIKNPNIPDVDNIIKADIIDTPEVIELLSYDSQYDPVLRKYSVEFKIRSIYGEAELSTSIFK